jgi:putative Holliday junction resolvase
MEWLAAPLTVLAFRCRSGFFSAVQDLVQRHDVQRIVVGHPRNLNGSVGTQARRAERLAGELEQHVSVPVILWDERLSTSEAERLVREAGKSVDRETIDAAAAAVILQSYLDSKQECSKGGTSGG